MYYTSREKLTVLSIEKDDDCISFGRLKEVVSERPANMIYFEQSGKLYGMISMGDIRKASEAGRKFVGINKSFTRVSPDGYMRARNIFHKRKNINALPVVDENGELMGEYARWDDLSYKNKYLFEGGGQKHIAMVSPSSSFQKRQCLYQSMYESLMAQGFMVEKINPNEIIDYMDKVDWMLFASKEECSAYETLIVYILHNNYLNLKFKTYSECFSGVQKLLETYLARIKEKGVHVLNLVCNENQYYKWLRRAIDERHVLEAFLESNYLIPRIFYQDFFEELYTESYAEEIAHLPLKISVDTDSESLKLKDCSSQYYNVKNGERCTVGQPETYKKVIYMVGPCTILGAYVEDKNTIASFLQERLNYGQYEVKVVNAGAPGYEKMDKALARIMDLPLKNGDVVVLYCTEARNLSRVLELNLTDILEQNQVTARWLLDSAQHCNHKVNSLYANGIFDALQPVLYEETEGRRYIGNEIDVVKQIYIDQYFSECDFSGYETIGAIVMNCNPYTYGHRYLIEEALSKVDFLIIFVVEEDKSVFTFAERFAMVQDGVAGLEHIMVVPSGPFILSQTTFPEYFIKAADEDLKKNVENDITLFAERIAPHLHITHRFVGEEPEDAVTLEYNEAMKRILPRYGIELREIPRKKQDGQYISASSVRRYLEANNMEGLKKLVPETTRSILYIKNE